MSEITLKPNSPDRTTVTTTAQLDNADRQERNDDAPFKSLYSDLAITSNPYDGLFLASNNIDLPAPPPYTAHDASPRPSWDADWLSPLAGLNILTTMLLPQAPPSYEGSIDTANCNYLAGWALDSQQPQVSVNVDVFVDDVFFDAGAGGRI